MRVRNCRVKISDPNMKLAIGSMEEISKASDGKRVVIETLYFLPNLLSNYITVNRTEDEVMVALLEMCLRRSMLIRDAMGNVGDDFYGWSYVQYKAVSFLTGEVVEDIVNKVWYGVEQLLNEVFCNIPYYSLREIHYSVKTREIVFAGDYSQALTPYVQFINHDTDQQQDTIVNQAMYVAGQKW